MMSRQTGEPNAWWTKTEEGSWRRGVGTTTARLVQHSVKSPRVSTPRVTFRVCLEPTIWIKSRQFFVTGRPYVPIRPIHFRAILPFFSHRRIFPRGPSERGRDSAERLRPAHTATSDRGAMSVSFDARDPTRTATRATVRQAGEIEALGEGVARCVARRDPVQSDRDPSICANVARSARAVLSRR